MIFCKHTVCLLDVRQRHESRLIKCVSQLLLEIVILNISPAHLALFRHPLGKLVVLKYKAIHCLAAIDFTYVSINLLVLLTGFIWKLDFNSNILWKRRGQFFTVVNIFTFNRKIFTSNKSSPLALAHF